MGERRTRDAAEVAEREGGIIGVSPGRMVPHVPRPPESPAPLCPHCLAKLHGFGRYCARCDRHLTPLESGVQPAKVAIPDTRSEEEIEAAIIGALETLGFFVAKLSQRRATQQTEGISDLIIMGFGAIAFAEIKARKGVQGPDQKVFEGHVRANGGRYCLWRSVEDATSFAASVMGRTQSEERTG